MTSSPHRKPSRSIGSRMSSALVNVVLLVATLAGVAYLAPAAFGFERYVITGGSMSGTFEKGAIAFEKRIPVEDLAVGDVITYQPPADSGVANLVTHRIVTAGTTDSGARLFRTQGDANPDPDPWTFQLTDGTQPVVEHTVPLVGWVMVGLADREIRMIAIGIPAALIALASLLELAKAFRPTPARLQTPAAAAGTSAAV
jgi:signal peptidase